MALFAPAGQRPPVQGREGGQLEPLIGQMPKEKPATSEGGGLTFRTLQLTLVSLS